MRCWPLEMQLLKPGTIQGVVFVVYSTVEQPRKHPRREARLRDQLSESPAVPGDTHNLGYGLLSKLDRFISGTTTELSGKPSMLRA